jgi:hypothetical protein
MFRRLSPWEVLGVVLILAVFCAVELALIMGLPELGLLRR